MLASHRRDAVRLVSECYVPACAAGGGGQPDAKAGGGEGGDEAAEQPLSPEVVTALLADRYAAKYARLGLSEINPLRHHAQAAKAAALAPLATR